MLKKYSLESHFVVDVTRCHLNKTTQMCYVSTNNFYYLYSMLILENRLRSITFLIWSFTYKRLRITPFFVFSPSLTVHGNVINKKLKNIIHNSIILFDNVILITSEQRIVLTSYIFTNVGLQIPDRTKKSINILYKVIFSLFFFFLSMH